MDVLTIPSKTTPANAIPFFILDLCFAPLHRQVEVAVIGVNAVLHFRPQEDLDGLTIYIDSFAIFDHCNYREGRRHNVPPPILHLSLLIA